MLNHVLYEINPDELYSLQVLNYLYGLLKDDGVLIVGEHIIPSIYEPKKELNFFEIWLSGMKLLPIPFSITKRHL